MKYRRVVLNSTGIYNSIIGGISRYSFELFKIISKNSEFEISRYPNSSSFENKKRLRYLDFLRNLPLAYSIKNIMRKKNLKGLLCLKINLIFIMKLIIYLSHLIIKRYWQFTTCLGFLTQNFILKKGCFLWKNILKIV